MNLTTLAVPGALARGVRRVTLWAALAMPALVSAQALAPEPTHQALQARVAEQVTPLLDALKDLVALESGSQDLEGLDHIASTSAHACRRRA